MAQFSKRQNFFLILALGILNALTPFSIDMYLPSFPSIANDLHVNVSQVALTVSIYFIGYALGQLFYGPLLDRFGRKKPLYAGLVIYILASVGCMLSSTIDQLLFFRLLSALGGCVASVAATTMVRDFFPPEDAPKVFSRLMLVLSLSPLLAPSIGSVVVAFAGWKTIFGILTGLGVVNLLVALYAVPPGAAPDTSVLLNLKLIVRRYKELYQNKQFATYSLAGAFAFTGLFVYVAGSPAIFMDRFHVSAQTYGAIFAFLVVGMVGGGQLNLLLSKRHTPQQIFLGALLLETVMALFFFLVVCLRADTLPATIGCLFFVLLGAGMTYPNAAALALEPFSNNVGSASALMGFTQLGIGALASSVVGLLNVTGSFPTAVTMAISSVVALILIMSVHLRKTRFIRNRF